jgi:uncharacterized protein (DUF58 family)
MRSARAAFAIDEGELGRVAHVAGRLLAGRPLLTPGHQPAPRRAGSGSEFLEHRAYAPGDDPRHIDWRASARSRRPQVRRYRDEASADWFLCLDVSASMGSAGGCKWTLARQLAYALAYVLLALGQRAGAVAFAGGPVARLPAGRGRHQLAHVLMQLRSLAPRAAGGATSLGAVATLVGPRDPLVVVSDFLREDALRPDLARLAHGGRELHAIAIGAPDDLRLPPAAAAIEDIESGARLEVEPARAGAAAEAWRALSGELAAQCRARGIVHSRCTAGEHWRDVVLRHLRTAARELR